MLTAGLEGMTSPGVCTVLMAVTLSGTITKKRSYTRLTLKEQQYIWIGLLALCPSMVSPQKN